MRPNFFLCLLVVLIPARGISQSAISLATRTFERPESYPAIPGWEWSVFSRQYFLVSNWNASGLSVSYTKGSSNSSAVLIRDGTSGFSWFHLILTHFQQFEKISGCMQLRFSLISTSGNLVFRPGGNLQLDWSLDDRTRIRFRVYDFSGFLLNRFSGFRGDPGIQLLVSHQPGRLIGITTGLEMGPGPLGPVIMGVSIPWNDRITLTGVIEALPFGFALGIHYRPGDTWYRGWFRQINGLGLNPMIEIGRKKTPPGKN